MKRRITMLRNLCALLRLNRILTAVLFLLATASRSAAHDPGLSTGQLRILPDRIAAEVIFARADIESLVQLKIGGDGKISVQELESARPALEKLAREAWMIRVGETSLPVEAPGFRFDETNNFHLTCSFRCRNAGV